MIQTKETRATAVIAVYLRPHSTLPSQKLKTGLLIGTNVLRLTPHMQSLHIPRATNSCYSQHSKRAVAAKRARVRQRPPQFFICSSFCCEAPFAPRFYTSDITTIVGEMPSGSPFYSNAAVAAVLGAAFTSLCHHASTTTPVLRHPFLKKKRPILKGNNL